MKDEFCASYLTRKTRSKMAKDEFYAFYLKKKMVPPQQSRSIDYYQDEERNTNVYDCPSVHQHYDSH